MEQVDIDLPSNAETRTLSARVTDDRNVESEFEYVEVFLDDKEQNLEKESQLMAKIWERESLDAPLDQSFMQELAPKFKLTDLGESLDFDTIKDNMIDVYEGKVFVKICQPNPDGKQITENCTVLYDCTLYHSSKEEPIDSSLTSGSPYLTRISESMTYGLARGLIEIREGETAQVYAHYSMAYGELGCMPKIPPKANIFFVVRVHRVWDDGELDQFLRMPESDQGKVSRGKIYDMCLKQKATAKEYVQHNHLREAIVRYKAIVKCLEDFFPTSVSARTSQEYKLRQSILENQLVAYNKMSMHRSATKVAKRILQQDPNNIKAMYHVAKAKLFLGDYDTSLKFALLAMEHEPKSPEFANLLLQLDYLKKEDATRSKDLLKKMSKGII